MSLMIQIHEFRDEEVSFMDALRNTCAENFLPESDFNCGALHEIRETALENDRLLGELLLLKPQYTDSYQAQWDWAEGALEQRVRQMRIPGCR